MVFGKVSGLVKGLTSQFGDKTPQPTPSTKPKPRTAKSFVDDAIQNEVIDEVPMQPEMEGLTPSVDTPSTTPFLPSVGRELEAPWYMQGFAASDAMHQGQTRIEAPRGTAIQDLSATIKQYENPQKLGLRKTINGKRFTMIPSPEGDAGNPNFTPYEIGYGIKVEKDWLSDDPTKWVEINGIPTDIRQGITPEQAEELMNERVNAAVEVVEKLPFADKLTQQGKMYWADMVYNGGKGVLKKNPAALKALEAGHTTEAMVLALDYIKAGGEKMRGLLERRVQRYNDAAAEISGAPIIESYTWGKDISVKFAYPFMTNTVSKEFHKKLDKDNRYKVAKGEGENKTYKVK